MAAKPTSKPLKAPYRKAIDQYYADLKEFEYQGVLHEGAVSSAFATLLRDTARHHKWVLIPQLTAKYTGETPGPIGKMPMPQDTGKMPMLSGISVSADG